MHRLIIAIVAIVVSLVSNASTLEEFKAMPATEKTKALHDTYYKSEDNRQAIMRLQDQAGDDFVYFDSVTGKNSAGIFGNSEKIRSVESGVMENRALINAVSDKLDSSVALSAAFSGLPRAYKGESVFGLGTGYHDGKSAIAAGLETSLGSWSFNAGASFADGMKAYKAGVGYHW